SKRIISKIKGSADDKASNSGEIKKGNNIIKSKINELTSTVATLDKKISKIAGCMGHAEKRIGNTKDAIGAMEKRMDTMQKEMHNLKGKFDDLKNRAYRANIRLVRLPEGAEDNNPQKFLETWLPQLLQLQDLPCRLEIEQVHWMLRPRLSPEDKLRMLVFKMLRFADKELIMRRTRALKSLSYKQHRIHLFPDLSTD
uniref:L1 transposable element RRM domain-containing protein n=1 Tax=Latimeria chalumnae TaxID=7897 RepID=H3AWZ3_LATCH